MAFGKRVLDFVAARPSLETLVIRLFSEEWTDEEIEVFAGIAGESGARRHFAQLAQDAALAKAEAALAFEKAAEAEAEKKRREEALADHRRQEAARPSWERGKTAEPA